MTDSAPLISVLMSVYNAAPYLRTAVDSVLNQSFSNYEFIIIDDGSTDSSSDILRSYSDPRISLLTNEQNIGLTRSLNRGLDIARGTYIARMDADDISLPDRFRLQVEYLDAHPEVDVLGTQMQIISPDAQPIAQYAVPTSHGAIIWALLFGLAIAHPTVFMRRAALMRAGGYNNEFLRAQDFALWAEMSKTSRFANLPDALHQYRVQPAAISQTHAADQAATLLTCRRELFSRILSHDIPAELIELIHRSQLKPSDISVFLTDQEIQAVLALMLTTYESLNQQGMIEPHEQEVVREDLLRRMMTASRCTGRIQRKPQRSIFTRLRRRLNI